MPLGDAVVPESLLDLLLPPGVAALLEGLLLVGVAVLVDGVAALAAGVEGLLLLADLTGVDDFLVTGALTGSVLLDLDSAVRDGGGLLTSPSFLVLK